MASHVLQTVFVSDDDMQTAGSLRENQEDRVVTPVDPTEPLNPVYTQPTPGMDDDLDVQPSRGPRDPADTTGEVINNLADVLKMSGLGLNFSVYLQPVKDGDTMVQPSERPNMALEWYKPF